MRRPLVAGNWKMNGNRESVTALLHDLAAEQSAEQPLPCETIVLPPAVYLDHAAALLQGTEISIGAQNVAGASHGAFTGEVSASMLRDLGCDYALVGHSERRTLFAERDDEIAEKFLACIEGGITPILCVGETLAEHERGETLQVVSEQLTAVIDKTVGSFAPGVVAYEPVWAIGTGKSATPEQAEAVHHHLRQLLGRISPDLAEQTRLLYGGSVNGDNAGELFRRENIDGALVGGASLDAKSFAKICRETA